MQLFAAAGTKNGADIRLAVDTVEDLSRHPDITHVTLVAGDSDFVPLAQRCKRMGRFVVGIGVAGSTSRALVNACDEFQSYEALPGVTPPPPKVEPHRSEPAKKAAAKRTTGKRAAAKKAVAAPELTEPPEQSEATALLLRAARVGLQKSDDEWMHSSSVKSQMQRMNPGFKEKSLGLPVVPRVHRVARRDPRDQGSSTTVSCSCGSSSPIRRAQRTAVTRISTSISG